MAEFYHSAPTEELIDDDLNIEARLEALLFIAPVAVTISQLASALESTTDKVKTGLKKLEMTYLDQSHKRGIRIQRHGKLIQLTTAPNTSEEIERLLDLQNHGKLSKASLEALAIIAYKQPVTRPEIDSIRGVNSDGVLKSLLTKGLIMEIGRAESPGRPFLYRTTSDFLQHFGLNFINDLPELDLDIIQPAGDSP